MITKITIALVLISSLFYLIAAEGEHVFAVKLHPDLSPDKVAEEHGFQNMGEIGGLDNHFLFKLMEHPSLRSDPETVELKASNLINAEGVLWMEKQEARERVSRPRF